MIDTNTMMDLIIHRNHEMVKGWSEKLATGKWKDGYNLKEWKLNEGHIDPNLSLNTKTTTKYTWFW